MSTPNELKKKYYPLNPGRCHNCYKNYNPINDRTLVSECTNLTRDTTCSTGVNAGSPVGNAPIGLQFLNFEPAHLKSCLPRDTEYYKRSFYIFSNLCTNPVQTADTTFNRQGIDTRDQSYVKALGQKGQKGVKSINPLFRNLYNSVS